ncbi:MAG: hypothetical protein ACK5JH_08155 [Anaerocolumna sp.]
MSELLQQEKLLQKVKETLELPNLIELQSAKGKDAKTDHKSEDEDFFGYKNSLAMSEEDINIVAKLKDNVN